MNFTAALAQLLAGRRMTRRSWGYEGRYVRVVAINMYRPCFVVMMPDGTEQPGWTPSTDDILAADDWAVAG